jgi:hypothetical protein
MEPIMPYTKVDIFREKGTKSFSKKSLGATEFYEKMGKKTVKNHSKLSHFDKNLNLNHK